jgi:PAT family beta-lactamase induction signal transducer AmpG
MLLFIVVFKLADVIAGSLTTPFLLDLGFSKTDVGTVNKAFGLVSTIVGTLAGGAMVARIGINRSLWILAFVQALANLSFTALAYMGKSYAGMVAAVGIDNFCSGMGTAAFVAFMMSLCDKRFTATQYALLSSLMGVSRAVVGVFAGFMVSSLGWPLFYAASVLGAAPGILLLAWFAPWTPHPSPLVRGKGNGG